MDGVRFGARGGGPPGGHYDPPSRTTPHRGDDLAAWRAALEGGRQVQIERLVEYRKRGVFPTYQGPDNSRHISHRTLTRQEPVFVDDNGVHCAVGYLMQRSGWGEAVDEISELDNHVLVEEVSSGPLVDWVLRSGLTVEEAAMIQPSYHSRPERPRPPPAPDPMIAEHRRLTNHFIAVEDKLRNDTPASIDLALERLQPLIDAGLSLDAIGGPES